MIYKKFDQIEVFDRSPLLGKEQSADGDKDFYLRKTSKNKYRFFYHYNKPKKIMTVHFKGVCYPVQNVTCHVPCETKWNDTQPQLVMRGFCGRVTIVGKEAFIY